MIGLTVWAWAMIHWFDITGPVTIITFVLMASGYVWWTSERDTDYDRYWMVLGF